MKPVFIAASPNTTFKDVLLAGTQLMRPWSWFSSKPVQKFEKQLEAYFPGRQAITLDSARSGFYLLLKSWGVGPGDEVILPAFTCLVIANPVVWVGAKPVYADVGDDFNVDLEALRAKVTSRTRVILVQHTFGKPVEIDKVREMAGEDVKIVEDLAHSLGGEYKKRKLGLWGDAAVATFGIEKSISTVRGGAVLVSDSATATALREAVKHAPRFSIRRVFVSLLNPVFWYLLTPVYYFGIGKATLGRAGAFLAHLLGLFGNMIEPVEYKTKKPKWLPAKFPGALASLGIHQFEKLDKLNAHRQKIAALYEKMLHIHYPVNAGTTHIYLRFPLLVESRKAVLQEARRHHVVLGDWYKSILYAPESSYPLLSYEPGEAARAELFAKHIINLPTGINVSEKAARRIAGFVGSFIWKYKS